MIKMVIYYTEEEVKEILGDRLEEFKKKVRFRAKPIIDNKICYWKKDVEFFKLPNVE